MALENPHVMEMDRSTSRLELVRINPTKQYATAGGTGLGLIIWQNGNWYDTGGNELPEDQVPQQCKDDIAKNPPHIQGTGPAVTAVCKFCKLELNSSEIERHYIEHVEQTMREVGTVPQTEAKNTHKRSEA